MWCFYVGKLRLRFHRDLFMRPWIGYYQVDASLTSTQRIVVHILGPLTTLVLTVSCYWIAKLKGESDFLNLSFYYLLFQFCFTAIPMFYPSFFGYIRRESDGLLLACELFPSIKDTKTFKFLRQKTETRTP